jgi:Endonuclease-reverse transcriptase
VFATEVILSEVYRNIEIVCVNIVMYGVQYLVIVYYWPPYFLQDDVAYCESSIQWFSDLIQRSSMHVILMGDFNLPDMGWSCYSAPSNVIYDMFTAFIDEFGLSQFVHAPIRISDTGKGHILDLVITNTHDIISDINVQNPFCTSDHCIIQFLVNTHYTDTIQEVCNDELYYDFKNADYEVIESFLATVNWGMSFHLPSVLKTIGIFLYSGFIEHIERHVPVKKNFLHSQARC